MSLRSNLLNWASKIETLLYTVTFYIVLVKYTLPYNSSTSYSCCLFYENKFHPLFWLDTELLAAHAPEQQNLV